MRLHRFDERDETRLATFGTRDPRRLRRVVKWCTRYLPAEVVGTVCAVLAAYLAVRVTGDRAVAAITGTMAENVGFLQSHGRHGMAAAVGRSSRRPLCMYVGPFLTGGIASGSLLGKLAADAVFYVVAAVSYEAVRRRVAAGGSAPGGTTTASRASSGERGPTANSLRGRGR